MHSDAQQKLLRYIFFIAFFLNLAFPRAGFYISAFPVTIANILFGGVSLIWLFKRLYFKKYPKNLFEWMGLVYFSYLIICALSGGEKRGAFIWLGIMAGYAALFFIAVDLLKDKRDILFIMRAITVTMGIVLIYGMSQIFFDIESISLPGLTESYGSPPAVIVFKDGSIEVPVGSARAKNIMWGGGRTIPLIIGHKIFSTFHHGNIFGLHLAIFIPSLFGLAHISSKKNRILLYILLVMAIVVLIFTNSRGALFAAGIGLIWLIILHPQSLLKILGVILTGGLIFSLIISTALFHDINITGVPPSIYLYHNFEPRYLEFGKKIVLSLHKDSQVNRKELDNLATQKFSLWRGAIKTVFKDRPFKKILLGNRFHNFYKTNQYKLYNFYFSLIFEMGLIGLGVFLLFLGYTLIYIFKSLDMIYDAKFRVIAMGGLSGLVGGLTHNIFDAPFYYPPGMANFWILAGVVVASLKNGRY